MADFLLEIGTEEIPARMITPATEELTRRMRELVKREQLGEAIEVDPFSTPRRIAVLVRGITLQQADVEEELMGPAVKVAYKDGEPTPAAHAFAKKAGLDLSQLKQVSTPKGDYLVASVTKKGRSAADLFADLLPKEIASIYWAKNMYWRAGKPERFVRPVRWMVAMLDGEVVPLEFAGIKAGTTSRGHRVLASGAVQITAPTEYAEKMRAAAVLPTYAQREQAIRKALDAATRAIPGARWREDKALLDTVVNLTEFPSVILGSFDREFLSLPEEVLVTVMRDHQKYFALEDSNGKLAPHFLAVLNTDGDPDGLIRHGNERVLRARFNDARFFWETDQKINLKQRVEMLKSVTFQAQLGSYYEKTLRVQKLACGVDTVLKGLGVNVRPGVVHKAALLAKTDLTTELVKEFTELQGIIGGLYTKAQASQLELNPEVAEAIGTAVYDHYKPESMDEEVPRTAEGAVLAIADKADTIVGMFGVGMIPSGSKDPFALRRAANGIVKTIAEHKLPLSLLQLMRWGRDGYEGTEAEKSFVEGDKLAQAIADFMRERVEFYLREVNGFSYDVVNAVLASGYDDVVDAVQRAQALAKVRGTEDFDAISASFKRIKNILKQADRVPQPGTTAAIKPEFSSVERAELTLMMHTATSAEKLKELYKSKNYDAVLAEIATVRKPLDDFFDKIMVMVDDPETRERRLGLLQVLFVTFSEIADFSEIVTERKSS